MKKLIALLAIFIFLTGNVKSQLIYYNWNPVYSPVSANLNSVYLSGALLASGNSGTVLYSSNAGANWTVLNTGTSANLYSAYGQTTVLSVGASGTILKSTNNGLNWTSNPSPTSNNLNSVSNYVSPNYKMVCGDGGKIFVSTNNGANWTEVNSGTANSLRCLYNSNSISIYRSYICGDNGTFIKLIYA